MESNESAWTLTCCEHHVAEMDHPGPSSSSSYSHVSDSCGTCDDQSSGPELESRPKRARFLGAYKYKSKFSKDWTKTWTFIVSMPHDPFSFRCTVCCKTLSCAHQGITDVRSHIAGKNHQRLSREIETQTQLSFRPDPLADKVSHLVIPFRFKSLYRS